MELTPELKKKLHQAASVSMQIEGYAGHVPPERRKRIKALMESYGFKVSIPSKQDLPARH